MIIIRNLVVVNIEHAHKPDFLSTLNCLEDRLYLMRILSKNTRIAISDPQELSKDCGATSEHSCTGRPWVGISAQGKRWQWSRLAAAFGSFLIIQHRNRRLSRLSVATGIYTGIYRGGKGQTNEHIPWQKVQVSGERNKLWWGQGWCQNALARLRELSESPSSLHQSTAVLRPPWWLPSVSAQPWMHSQAHRTQLLTPFSHKMHVQMAPN
jgi:hypothetical protein